MHMPVAGDIDAARHPDLVVRQHVIDEAGQRGSTAGTADEPTGQLDAKSSQEVLALLGRLNQEFGKTIVVVTHNPQVAARAKRQLHLEKGTFVEQAQQLATVSAGGGAR